MKSFTISMSKLYTTFVDDITQPIYVKDLDAEILLPEELRTFFSTYANPATFWVETANSSNTISVKNDVGVQNPKLKFQCFTASESGFSVLFAYRSSDRVSQIFFHFDDVDFKPNLKIKADELLSFLTMSPKDSWFFIVQHCKLRGRQVTVAKKYCLEENLDFYKIDTKLK